MSKLFLKLFGLLWLAQISPVVLVGTAAWHLQFKATGLPEPLRLDLGFLPPLPVPFLIVVTGVFASALFAALLAWQFSKPIKTLNREFKHLSDDPLTARPGTIFSDRNDELNDLGKAFRGMSDTLRELLIGQKHLLHNVSHELRSPLSRIQASADLLVQQPERTAELTARVHQDVGLMDQMVSELLAIARLDSGVNVSQLSAIALDELVDSVIESVTFSTQDTRSTITQNVQFAGPLWTDRSMLMRALENLLRNAVKHGRDAANIEIDVRCDDASGVVHITVSDDGPGVDPVNLNTLFDPFFREPSPQKKDGFGLGLSIARRIAETLGGSASAALNARGGLSVALHLPRDHHIPSHVDGIASAS